MIVTATEFKTNFGKYLDMLRSEDIFITRNGKTVAKMVNPNVYAGTGCCSFCGRRFYHKRKTGGRT